MSDTHNTSEPESEEHYTPLAIEGELPLKSVGIENLKEANPKHMPPHRYIHPWFARRPTPAARLAILGSVMPEGTDPDRMLSLMQIGPDGLEEGISEYVEERKTTEGKRKGTLGEWYGYPRPFTQTPTNDEMDEFHQLIKETWDGELPTVLDATAGGGVIPFESIRYGLPTIANELNPVPSVILKILLEYAPEVGSLEEQLYNWRDKITSEASENLAEYYPTERDGQEILASTCTYTIDCDSCGGTVPTIPKWWIQKNGSLEGTAIKPEYDNGGVKYQCVELDGTKYGEENFDPSNGNVTRGDVECPHCGVVMESEAVKPKFREDDFDYDVYAVKYSDPRGGSGYRAGTKIDTEAIEKAQERIDSDFELMTFLTTEIPEGQETDRLFNWGITEWRDIFTPRQLLAHYEYLQAFKKYSNEIHEEHDKNTAEAILTILSISASKFLNYNSRLTSWHTGRGYPDHIFKTNNFAFCRIYTDNKPSTDGLGYNDASRKVIDCYEELVEMAAGGVTATTRCGDAATLTDTVHSGSIQAAVVDPPYYDSIMYSELSDVFYVLQKEYLSETHPDLFSSELTNKTEEAVANPSKFDGLDSNTSKTKLAKHDYEDKMQEIFSELYDCLEPGGVLTIMFTHKKTDAWDTLATSLIEAGFTITATHPITSEIPTRAGMRGSNSADSTILLTGRKPVKQKSDTDKTLWDDVRDQTRVAATKAATELFDSGLSLTKTDTIIATFGPTLQVFAENYPVVDKKGETVPPRDALTEARNAAVKVLVDQYLDTEQFADLDSLTKWYILAWLVYEDNVFPYDEGRQLGIGVGIDVDSVKKETKIWGKRQGDIQLKDHTSRVQDITMLEAGEDVSQRKYPVNPTNVRFTHTINTVHSAVHVYEQKGADAAWNWLSERGYKNDRKFATAITALLEVLPPNNHTAETLRDIISGKTGDYLDIDTTRINLNIENDDDDDEQSGLNDY
jgi:adenine-specific DNA methylase